MTKRKSSYGSTERVLKILAYLSQKPCTMAELIVRLEQDLEYAPNRVTIQNDLTRLKDWGFSLAVENRNTRV